MIDLKNIEFSQEESGAKTLGRVMAGLDVILDQAIPDSEKIQDIQSLIAKFKQAFDVEDIRGKIEKMH